MGSLLFIFFLLTLISCSLLFKEKTFVDCDCAFYAQSFHHLTWREKHIHSLDSLVYNRKLNCCQKWISTAAAANGYWKWYKCMYRPDKTVFNFVVVKRAPGSTLEEFTILTTILPCMLIETPHTNTQKFFKPSTCFLKIAWITLAFHSLHCCSVSVDTSQWHNNAIILNSPLITVPECTWGHSRSPRIHCF